MPDRLRQLFVEDNETGCWNWARVMEKKGYGKYKKEYAHRFMYKTIKGEIPEGLVIDHRCRNKRCVNPDHLEPVRQRENVMRGESITALNVQKETCSRGHWLGGDNIRIVVKPDAVRRQCKACDREYHRIRRDRINPNRKRYPVNMVHPQIKPAPALSAQENSEQESV